MIAEVLDSVKTPSGIHTELRVHCNYSRRISVTNGNVLTNLRSQECGVFARAWHHGTYGAASLPGLDRKNIDLVLDKAWENAKILSLSGGQTYDLPTDTPVGVSSTGSFTDLPQEDLLDYVRELNDLMAGRYPGVTGQTAMLMMDCSEVRLKTSAGADVYRVLPRAHVMIKMMTVDKHGVPVDLSFVVGGGGNFGDHFSRPQLLEERIDRLYQQLMGKREGIYPEAGTCDILLGSGLAGLLAHEAVGHTTESDIVRGGSVAKFARGQQVASSKVTLVDFAHTAFGVQAPIPVYTDDEGTPGQDVEIIRNGILCDYMTNLQDAKAIDAVPKGNARAYSYSDEPLVRMRNTCILPGQDSFDDMLASIDHGYYLQHWSNGQADSTSEFMFGVNMGYEIKNGKLGRAIRDTTISGVAFEMLKTVDMVGNDLEWVAYGLCGKKQPMGNAMGGPTLKCKLHIGGR